MGIGEVTTDNAAITDWNSLLGRGPLEDPVAGPEGREKGGSGEKGAEEVFGYFERAMFRWKGHAFSPGKADSKERGIWGLSGIHGVKSLTARVVCCPALPSTFSGIFWQRILVGYGFFRSQVDWRTRMQPTTKRDRGLPHRALVKPVRTVRDHRPTLVGETPTLGALMKP